MNSRLDTIRRYFTGKVANSPLSWKGNLVAQHYHNEFNGKYKTPAVPEGYYSSWAQYNLVSEYREEQRQSSNSRKFLPWSITELGMHQQNRFPVLRVQAGDFVAERLADRVFSLPMHPYLESSLNITCHGNTKNKSRIYGSQLVMHDARVLKQAESLVNNDYDVTVIGIKDNKNNFDLKMLSSSLVVKLVPWKHELHSKAASLVFISMLAMAFVHYASLLAHSSSLILFSRELNGDLQGVASVVVSILLLLCF